MTTAFHIPTVAWIHDTWLPSLGPDEIVGTCRNPSSCLVARAAEAMNPGIVFEVGTAWNGEPGSIAAYGDEYELLGDAPLPDDLNRLADRFDTLAPMERDVTAAEVLARWPDLIGGAL